MKRTCTMTMTSYYIDTECIMCKNWKNICGVETIFTNSPMGCWSTISYTLDKKQKSIVYRGARDCIQCQPCIVCLLSLEECKINIGSIQCMLLCVFNTLVLRQRLSFTYMPIISHEAANCNILLITHKQPIYLHCEIDISSYCCDKHNGSILMYLPLGAPYRMNRS